MYTIEIKGKGTAEEIAAALKNLAQEIVRFSAPEIMEMTDATLTTVEIIEA